MDEKPTRPGIHMVDLVTSVNFHTACGLHFRRYYEDLTTRDVSAVTCVFCREILTDRQRGAGI